MQVIFTIKAGRNVNELKKEMHSWLQTEECGEI